VLPRESIRRLSIAMGLSVLAHVGLPCLLAGQTRMTRAWPVFLIDVPEHTAPRAEPGRLPLEPRHESFCLHGWLRVPPKPGRPSSPRAERSPAHRGR